MSDSATYIACARSLAAFEGYNCGDVPQTYWPPGYPVLLSVPIALGTDSVLALKIVNVVVAAIVMVVFFLVLNRFLRRPEAFLLVAVVGVFFPWVYYTHAIVSDITFAAAVGLFLLAGYRYECTRSWRHFWVFTIVAMLAPLVRSAGIALLPAWGFVVFLSGGAFFGEIRSRQWKSVTGHVAMVPVVLLGVAWWFGRNMLLAGAFTTYSVGTTPEYALSLAKIGITDFGLWTRIMVNLRGYVHILVVPDQVSIDRVGSLAAPVRLACYAVSGLVIVGWVRCLVRRACRFAAVTYACYLALLALNTWYDIRYLLPVMVLHFLFIYEGVSFFVELVWRPGLHFGKPELRAKAIAALKYAFLVLCLLANLGFTLFSSKGAALRSREQKPHIQRLVEACRYIRESETPGRVLVAGGGSFVLAWSGRTVCSSLQLLDADRELKTMELPGDLAFVLLDESKFAPYRQEYLEPLVEANKDRLQEVFRTGDTIVYRVLER